MNRNTLWVVVKSSIGLVLAVALVVAVYRYGLAKNEGRIPPWADTATSVLWGLVILIMIPIVTVRRERRWVGDLPKESLVPSPGETVLFKNSFLSAEFYRNADTFNPNPSFRQWIRGGPININRMLRVCITNHRLAFGRLGGPTYRIVPLNTIRRCLDVDGRWPYHNSMLIEYDYHERREGILIWVNSVRGRRLRACLGELVPGEASRKGGDRRSL